MNLYGFIPEVVSLAISIAAAVMAYLAFRVSQQTVGLQTYMRYFEANNFQLENWEVVSPLTPLGKCASRQEAVVKAYLLHRLNRFRWDRNLTHRKLHKIYARAMFGSSLSEFRENLVRQGANEELAKSAAKILKAIRFEDPYFALDRRLWDEYFGAKYFDESGRTQSA